MVLLRATEYNNLAEGTSGAFAISKSGAHPVLHRHGNSAGAVSVTCNGRTLHIRLHTSEETRVDLYDPVGKRVFFTPILTQEKATFSLNNLAPGIYTLHMHGIGGFLVAQTIFINGSRGCQK